MYRIGEFSKMAKTTIKTLRYYDETGLLAPEKIDSFTSYRFYTSRQLIELHAIQSMRQIGLSIDEIKLIQSNSPSQSRILERRKSQILSALSALDDQLSRIEFILSGQEEAMFMNYQAIIKELPECVIYSKETVVPNYDAYFALIPSIGEKVAAKYPSLKCTTPEYCFIRYLDGEYKETDIHIEFCEAVDAQMDDFDDIKFKKISAATVVSVMHKGPYSTLANAYAFITKWIDENNFAMADNARESYIDGIWNKSNPEEWLTELQIPVVKK